MPISHSRFVKGLKKSKDRIYLFNGDENFLKDQGVSLIIDKFDGQYDEDFDYLEYYGKDVNSDELGGELVTTPMMSEYRLIIIRNVDKCDVKSKNVIKKWLDDPSDFIIFVTTTSEQISLKKATQFFQKLSTAACTVSCYKLEHNDMQNWIINKLNEFNKSIDDSAIEYLIDMVGFDLYKMQNELKKVNLYVKDKNTINLKDVTNVVSDVRSDTIFELVDSIVNKDLKQSLRMSKNVIRESGDAIALVSLLYRKLMQGSIIIDMTNKRQDDSYIIKALGISPYILKQSKMKMGKIANMDIFSLFRKLLDVDMSLKSSPISCNAVVEDLIIEFCS